MLLILPFLIASSEAIFLSTDFSREVQGEFFLDTHFRSELSNLTLGCYDLTWCKMLVYRTSGRRWFTLPALPHISAGENLFLKSCWKEWLVRIHFGLHMQPSSRPISTSEFLRSRPPEEVLCLSNHRWIQSLRLDFSCGGSSRSTGQTFTDIVPLPTKANSAVSVTNTVCRVQGASQCSPGSPVKCNFEEPSC